MHKEENRENNNETESQEKWRIIHKYFHVLFINIVYINHTYLIGKIELLRRQIMLAHKNRLTKYDKPP